MNKIEIYFTIPNIKYENNLHNSCRSKNDYEDDNNMEISLDLKADALYIKFQEGKFAKNKKVDNDTVIDMDAKGRLLGIEMLNVTKKISAKDLADVNVKLPLRTNY